MIVMMTMMMMMMMTMFDDRVTSASTQKAPTKL